MIPSPTRGDETQGRTRKDPSHTTYDCTDNIEIADRVRSSASKLPSVAANYHLDHVDGFPPKYETMMDERGGRRGGAHDQAHHKGARALLVLPTRSQLRSQSV